MDKAKKRKHHTMESSVDGTEGGTSKKNLFCDVCKIVLPNEISMRQHILGQKHKKIYNAKEEQRRVEQKCGIFIKGFPPHLTQNAVLDYFSEYGQIVWVHFGHTFALLDYNEPSSVQNVITRDHYLGGKHVMISYRKLKKEVTFEKPRDEDEDESMALIQSIKDIPNFDDQLQVLAQHLQPDKQELFPKYRRICADLYEILSYTFPRCNVHPFGSTITGLNFKNSDIDVYISGIRQEGNDRPHLYRTKTILLNSQRFTNVIVIAGAKIPIVKCVHVETGISCDFNMRNQLGVCNSELINYYLNINPKLKKLMIFLKYWAKVHKFTGQGYLFSNYALCMMLIFFLQQEPYNVPSILSLQQNPHTFRFYDGWNGGFQQISVNAASLRYTTLLKLLENFFSFYGDFAYGINVICPFLGRTVKKEQFENPDALPNCFQIYKVYLRQGGRPFKTYATICIQDPFEHCRNTSPIASTTELEKFVCFCRFGKKLCQDGENSLLYNLLTMVPPDCKSQVIIKPEFSQFSVPMKPNLRYIEEKIDNTLNRQEEIREAWFKSIVEFALIVLKDFLKFDVTESNDPTEAKNNKCEGQSDVYDKKKNRVSYDCSGKINLWDSRKTTAKLNGVEEKNQGIIKREVAITNHLCQVYKDIPQSSSIIHFQITLENNLAAPEVVVKIKKIMAFKKTFKTFAKFLSANLCNWFEVYERELDGNK